MLSYDYFIDDVIELISMYFLLFVVGILIYKEVWLKFNLVIIATGIFYTAVQGDWYDFLILEPMWYVNFPDIWVIFFYAYLL